MAEPLDNGRDRAGIAIAIVVSALGHAALLYVAFFVVPQWLAQRPAAPPVYTVKVVDSLPAGDLGTHLPKLAGRRHPSPPQPRERNPEREARKQPPKSPPPPAEAPNSDRNALALNRTAAPTPRRHPTPTATPTPTPEPQATARPTHPAPSRTPRRVATPRPTRVPERHHQRPTPRPTPRPRPTRAPESRRGRPTPRATPEVRLTREEAVKEKMAALHRQLLAEHLKEVARNANEGEGDEGTSAARRHSAGNGGGPVLGSVETAGSGYGIGPGTGSAGVLKSPEFVMYYRAVQERIKKNWSFWGGNNSLTATVYFAIGSDGQLTAAPRVTQSSRDNAYDESVLRAIQRAAPFPAPPEECRELFGRGVEATFKLGDLNS